MKFIYNIYAILCAFILLLILALFALSFSFIKDPKGGNLIYKACSIYAKVWFVLTGMRYSEIRRKNDNVDKPYIYIANHRSYIDILIMLRAMHAPFRPLGKEEIAKVPLFGYFYNKVVIKVQRGNSISRSQSFMHLKNTIQQGISVFIFPEGTFNETDDSLKHFYDGAFRLALKTKTNIQPLVFVDDLQRMHYKNFFTMTPGKCRVVFLDEINMNNFDENDIAGLKQYAFDSMYKTLHKYHIK